MSQPRFRFIDGNPSPSADAQFWRDAEASERLGSRFKANLFLRALCRSRAWDSAATGADPLSCTATEHQLLNEMLVRGFGVFGPDLDRHEAATFADVG